MNKFDQIFFSQYVDESDSIARVFHRHVFIVLEDITLWTFFWLFIPGFLYYYNAFSLQSSLESWQVNVCMILIYIILIYKLCDWYYDVWIATERTMIDVRWKWFTSNLLYIPYDKIEGVEVRTRSIFHSFLGISDVIIKLSGDDTFTLTSAAKSSEILSYIQSIGSKKRKFSGNNREPFDILVETLSDVVKGQMLAGGKEYITEEYIEKLDSTLIDEDTIDLRKPDEKIIIENWKKHHEYSDDSTGEATDHH